MSIKACVVPILHRYSMPLPHKIRWRFGIKFGLYGMVSEIAFSELYTSIDLKSTCKIIPNLFLALGKWFPIQICTCFRVFCILCIENANVRKIWISWLTWKRRNFLDGKFSFVANAHHFRQYRDTSLSTQIVMENIRIKDSSKMDTKREVWSLMWMPLQCQRNVQRIVYSYL